MKIPRRILKQEGVTARVWKQDKRYQARVIDRMVSEFCFGMAYSPAKKYLDSLRRSVKNVRRALKISQWGN